MPDSTADGALAANHKGPCAFYMKRVYGEEEASATGPGWFKIFESGYDNDAKQWYVQGNNPILSPMVSFVQMEYQILNSSRCTEKIIAQDGLISVTIPSGLPTGDYLVRTELLALHQAYRGDPQFYVGCAQVFVSTGAAAKSGLSDVPRAQLVSIPGHVDAADPGVTFDIFNDDPARYVVPGPKIWHPLLESGAATKTVVQADEYKIPDGCLLVNGNVS